MFLSFEKSWKKFFASQPAAKKKKFFLLSVIGLLHSSLKIFLITFTVIWWGYHPRNSNRAQKVFVVKRRSRAALDNRNRLCYKKSSVTFQFFLHYIFISDLHLAEWERPNKFPQRMKTILFERYSLIKFIMCYIINFVNSY